MQDIEKKAKELVGNRIGLEVSCVRLVATRTLAHSGTFDPQPHGLTRGARFRAILKG
ncbi:MAG: hypothetical protein GQ528_07805 [Woeseiaceae bacterium]|nr:hypothetical protein [Woeseiaceae bacterium]